MGQFIYDMRGYNSGWQGPASELYVRGASAWEKLGQPYADSPEDWPTKARSAFYKDGSGNWKRFYSGIDYSAVGIFLQDITFTSAPAEAIVQFINDGTVDVFTTFYGNGEAAPWDISGAPDINDLQIKVQHISGSGVSGTLNTWIALSGNPAWGVNSGSFGYAASTLEGRFRHSPTGIELGSPFAINLEAFYTSG